MSNSYSGKPKYDTGNLERYEILDYVPVLDDKELDFVYRPNDDSYFLLDALKMDFKEILNSEPGILLEIGSGSGIIINNLASWFCESSQMPLFLATDINYDAAYLTYKYSNKYKNNIEVINTNICSGILDGKVDILICNPPYVPTSSEELASAKLALFEKNELIKKTSDIKELRKINCIAASWAGGEEGNEITFKILEEAKRVLSPKGCFYLLLIQENQPKNIAKIMREAGFDFELLLFKRFSNEYQYIFKFFRV